MPNFRIPYEPAVGLVYFCAVLAAPALAPVAGGAPLVWPANAIAVGLILRCADANMPLAILLCSVAGFCAHLALGLTPALATTLTAAHMAEIVCCLPLLRMLSAEVFPFSPERAFAHGYVFACLGPVLLSAVLGSLAVHHATGRDLLPHFFGWWSANAAGLLLFLTPTQSFSAKALRSISARQWAELAVFLALAAGVTAGHVHLASEISSGMLVLLMLAATLRLGLFGICTLAIAEMLFALADLRFLHPSFSVEALNAAALTLQLKVILLVFPILVLAHLLASYNRTQRALHRQFAAAHEAKEEMENLIHIVSHDLKSPLMTIQGFASLFGKYLDAGMEAKAKAAVTRIHEGVMTMSCLIDDVLQLSRVGRNPLDLTDFMLSALVAEVQSLLGAKIALKRAKIELADEGTVLHADRAKVLRAVLNLIDNALEYGCPSPHSTITVGCSKKPDETLIYVRDNGPGLDPDVKDDLFKLFFRHNRTVEGTGAGLAIVKKVAERHGGTAWAYSRPGHGATFWMSIPSNIQLPPDRDEADPALRQHVPAKRPEMLAKSS